MKKAFTLVEMLIVIVIIGILAAALIPRLTGIQGRARDVARAGDLQQLISSLAVYQMDNNGGYPAVTTQGTFQDVATISGQLASYLKSMPKEGQSGKTVYGYTTTSGGVAAVAATQESNKGNWSLGSSLYSGLATNATPNSVVVTSGGNAQMLYQ